MSKTGSNQQGNKTLLANRYANAIFMIAQERQIADSVTEDFSKLTELLKTSKEFRFFVATPLLSRVSMAKVMESLSSAAQLSDYVGRFMKTLAMNGRMSCLEAVIEAYHAKMAKKRGETTARVTTARGLTPETAAKVVAMLRSIVGGEIQIKEEVNPDILGGFVAQYGTYQIDASLQGKLNRLERQLKTQKEAA